MVLCGKELAWDLPFDVVKIEQDMDRITARILEPCQATKMTFTKSGRH